MTDVEKTAPLNQRPTDRSTENEALRPAGDGRPPRPASEPQGAQDSQDSAKTRTDPGSGEN